MNTESIKKLGWPYNLYSAISGLSIPDDTTTKSYYYKYQKGYYCFFLTRPEEAHKKMMEFLNRFYYFKYNTIGLSAIIHKYGFGKSYDEIVTMYNNHDIRYYSPILAFDRFADSLFSRDITVRDLIKYEAHILHELRLYRPYSDYLRCWPDDMTQPVYRKFITPNDRLKLYALSNKRFGYGLFTINSTKLVSKGIDFSEYLTDIIDSDTIISVLEDNNIYTLEDLCSSEMDKITLHMNPNDIERLFNHYLYQIGIRLKNSKYLKDAIRHACYLERRAKRQAKKEAEEADRKQRAAENAARIQKATENAARIQKATENSKMVKEETKEPKIIISYKPVSKPKIVVQHIKYSNPIIQYLYDLFYILDHDRNIYLLNTSIGFRCDGDIGYRLNGLLFLNTGLIHEMIHTRYENVYGDKFVLSFITVYKAFEILSIINTSTRGIKVVALNEELARKCLNHPKATDEYLTKHGYGKDDIKQNYKETIYGKTHPAINRAIYDFSSVSSKATYSDIDYYFNSTEPEFVDYEYLNSIGIRYTPDSDDLYAE